MNFDTGLFLPYLKNDFSLVRVRFSAEKMRNFQNLTHLIQKPLSIFS